MPYFLSKYNKYSMLIKYKNNKNVKCVVQGLQTL